MLQHCAACCQPIYARLAHFAAPFGSQFSSHPVDMPDGRTSWAPSLGRLGGSQ